ncbi:MAG: hypothetical protein E7178_01715 [Erysipelotrichaceae bacterium]|jgi:hypothetical protein|nr:hypothetical protein [Erysipelotrichaceae bacterium]
MKNKRIIILVIIITLVIVSIIGAALSWHNCWQSFWSISIGEVVTIFIAVFIAYIASQFKSNESKIKYYIEQELNTLRNIGNDNVLFNLPTIGKNLYKQEINLLFTKIDNIIACLEKTKKDFDYEKDIAYISSEFKELSVFVSEKIENYDYLVESTTLYRKHFNKISDRSLEIILNLYK